MTAKLPPHRRTRRTPRSESTGRGGAVPRNGEEALDTAAPSPLRRTSDGALRIGSSRITLDVVVEQFEKGMTPEQLVDTYIGLRLADVYAAISIYLRMKKDVRQYLRSRREAAHSLRTQIEKARPRISRGELVRRRASGAGGNADAATGDCCGCQRQARPRPPAAPPRHRS